MSHRGRAVVLAIGLLPTLAVLAAARTPLGDLIVPLVNTPLIWQP